MRDSEFIRGKVPMTKEEIRTLSIERLELENAKCMLDIGGGSGSVSIEAAVKNPDLEVYTIEMKDEGIEVINENKKKFNTEKVNVIQAMAPHYEFDKKVDRVFIGGSGGNLNDIIKWCKSIMDEKGIIVINSITLETLNDSIKYLREQGFNNVEGMMVNVSRLEKLGRYDYFKPLNPTYIISGQK